MREPPYSPRHDAGFATAAVLAGLATVALLMTAAMTTMNFHHEALDALERQTLEQATTRSAMDRIFAAIEDGSDAFEVTLMAQDQPLPMAIGTRSPKVLITGEAGKLNPATSDQALLISYAVNVLQLPTEDARAFAAAMRSDSDTSRANWHKTFLENATYEQMIQDFGSYNETNGIDPLYANEEVLASVPDLEGLTADILRRRREEPVQTRALSPHFNATPAPFTVSVSLETDIASSMAATFALSSGGKIVRLKGPSPR